MNDAVATYRMLEVASGLKVGDEVKITRRARDHEKGWTNDWVDDMYNFIGDTGTILSMDEYGVSLEEIPYAYPVFVLEKVTE